MHKLKAIILHLCRMTGLFRLASHLTRGQLNILCYHGFSYHDEHAFRPKLFIRTDTLERRLNYLRRRGYHLLSLDQGVKLLQQNKLPDHAMVVTVDDGWHSTYELAAPLFSRYDIPWTLYLTTYYVVTRLPVINIAVQYMLWKTQRAEFDLRQVMPETASEAGRVRIDGEKSEALHKMLIDYCDGLAQTSERQDFLERLADVLEVDWERHQNTRSFFLIDAGQCRELQQQGVDIELHTHRHYLPTESKAAMMRELNENEAVIKQICGADPKHFCFPSGAYNPEQISWFEETGLCSATTCEPGLNNPSTSKFLLRRFLDGENISQIEFEAEISGFKPLLRKLRYGS